MAGIGRIRDGEGDAVTALWDERANNHRRRPAERGPQYHCLGFTPTSIYKYRGLLAWAAFTFAVLKEIPPQRRQ